MSSNNQTPLTQKFLSLTPTQARALADDVTVNFIITHSGYLSITLFRKAVIDIATMRSRKFAAKSAALLAYEIEENPDVQEYVRAGMLWHMMYVIDALVINCVPYVTKTSDVRIIAINNSPDYTPVFVGDSKHYISCLRIGYYTMSNTQPRSTDALERCIKRTPKGRPTTVNWQHTNTYRGTQGCNAEFLDAEVKAFGMGILFYVGVGPLPFEGVDSKGLTSRMRCIRINGRSPKIIINRIYGDDSRLADMLTKLNEVYPKHKIFIPSGLRQLGLKCTPGMNYKQSAMLGKVYTDYGYDRLREVTAYTRPRHGYTIKCNTDRKRIDLRDRDDDLITMRAMVTTKQEFRINRCYSLGIQYRRGVYAELRDNHRNYKFNKVTSRLPRIIYDVAKTLGYVMMLANNGYDFYTKGNVPFTTIVKGKHVEGVTWKGKDGRRYSVVADKWTSLHYLTRGTRVKEVYSVALRRWIVYTGDIQEHGCTITEQYNSEIKQLILRTLR